MIWKKSDRAFAREQAVTDANARMIHKFRTDAHVADLEVHRIEFFDFDFSRQIVKRDREKRRRHLAFKNLAHAEIGAVITKNPDIVLVVVGGHKEREALNVVPMNVRDQKA